MKTTACRLALICVSLSASTACAGIIYNANDAYVANENGATPTPTFGPFATGIVSETGPGPNTPNTSTFTAFGTGDHATGFASITGLNGYASGGGSGVPLVLVNITGANLPATGISVPNIAPNEMLLHPGNLNVQDADFRFTAPATSNYQLTGYFETLANTGTGVYVNVLVNGVSEFGGLIPSGPGVQSNFSGLAAIPLLAGGTIDFTVGSNGSFGSDSTGLFVSLAQVPEPSAFILCGLGALGLFVTARRRRKV